MTNYKVLRMKRIERFRKIDSIFCKCQSNDSELCLLMIKFPIDSFR